MKQFVEIVYELHQVRIGASVGGKGLLGVIKHTCTQTHASVVSLKDIIVSASFTSSPELIVVSEFRERYGLVAHTRVEFHYRERSGNGEQFSERKSKSSQLERFRLDGAGKAKMAVFWVDNQSGCRYEISMTPALDVAEPYKTVAVKSDYAFTACDLLSDILRGPLGDACTTLESRLVNQIYDLLGVYGFFGFGVLDSDVVDIHRLKSPNKDCCFENTNPQNLCMVAKTPESRSFMATVIPWIKVLVRKERTKVRKKPYSEPV